MKKLFLLLALPFIAASAFAVDKDGPFSPFDALTKAEVATVVAILHKAGDADDQTYFPTITMQEGQKADIRAWVKGKPIQRTAFVVMRRQGL